MKSHLLTIILLLPLINYAQKNSIDLKAVDESLIQISEDLYAAKYEVSNAQYNAFLKNLQLNRRQDDFQIARIHASNWSDSSTYNPPFEKNYHTHKSYAEYPVVNISHKGAQLFCSWLTEQYNSSNKTRFNKVRFRLPTEEEWVLAASAGDQNAIYPWNGSSLQSEDGNYLANFDIGGGDTTGIAGYLTEHADLTTPVASYQPNALGFYNMAGNVAEMINEQGVTKGGSWRDPDKALMIDSNGNYEGPSPTVGFRYFMEVLEE